MSSPPQPSAAVAPYRSSRTSVARVATYGALGCVFLVCWVALVWVNGATFGVQIASLAALLAALPLFVVVPVYLWLDRLEAEPTRYLILAFLWGALVAPVGALALNTLAEVLLTLSGSEDADMVTAVLSAPPVEETFKGAVVLAILLFRRREFDGVIDGVVYAGLAGAGFAFSENVLYLGHAYTQGGTELTATFILRCVMAPFAHPLFTACIGIGLGLAVSARSGWGRFGYGLAGYGCAVLLHMIWNASAAAGAYFKVYFAFQVPVFVGFVAMVVLLRRRESVTIRRYLSQYADAGWLTHPEVAMLATAGGRRAARGWAKARGPVLAASMRGFQDSASDLALLRSRMNRGAAPADAARHEWELLNTLSAHRQSFAGPTH